MQEKFCAYENASKKNFEKMWNLYQFEYFLIKFMIKNIQTDAFFR